MKYLIGSKNDFHKFVNLISKDDKVGIMTHTDLDGLASAIFLEKILESKNLKVEAINFTEYRKGMFEGIFKKFKDKKITKVFLTDIAVDEKLLEEFNLFRKEFDCFWIDHHPFNYDLEKEKQIIKNETPDCTTYVLYNLAKQYLDVSAWDWLVTATMIAEFSFNSDENLKFLEKKCSDIKGKESIDSSKAFYFANLMGSTITYFRPNLEKAFELIKKKDFEEMKKYYDVVEAKMEEAEKKYKENVEYYKDKNLYFGFLTGIYMVSPPFVGTRLSKQDDDGIYFVVYEHSADSKLWKISSRCQSGKVDLDKLIKKSIEGLEGATGGGHKKAAAAIILKKDLEKFKNNLLK